MSQPDRGAPASALGSPLRRCGLGRGPRQNSGTPSWPRERSADLRRQRTLLVLIAAVVALLAGCESGPTAPAASPASPPAASHGSGTSAPAASRLLEPAAFAAKVAEPTRFTINVHVPFEGSIDGTDADIPFDRLDAEAARLPTDRSAPLAIYCRSGRMSAIAASNLAHLGYRDVVELRGGMQAWTQQGFSLIATPPAPTR